MECGTIETDTILSLGSAVIGYSRDSSSAKSSLSFVDAPVSGGPMGAEDGTLTFMVGADDNVLFEAAKKVLAHMGKKESIFHCGEVGSGTAFKEASGDKRYFGKDARVVYKWLNESERKLARGE